jgi:hypothetical protein
MRALENDEIFVDFITGNRDSFVIEDADHLLMARSRGNVDLRRILAVEDGVVRARAGRSFLPPICLYSTAVATPPSGSTGSENRPINCRRTSLPRIAAFKIGVLTGYSNLTPVNTA